MRASPAHRRDVQSHRVRNDVVCGGWLTPDEAARAVWSRAGTRCILRALHVSSATSAATAGTPKARADSVAGAGDPVDRQDRRCPRLRRRRMIHPQLCRRPLRQRLGGRSVCGATASRTPRTAAGTGRLPLPRRRLGICAERPPGLCAWWTRHFAGGCTAGSLAPGARDVGRVGLPNRVSVRRRPKMGEVAIRLRPARALAWAPRR
jgi:hypothetical protein